MKKLWPWLWLLAAAGGCVQPSCPREHLSLETLVARHNANADKVDRLWARASIRVDFQDDKGRRVTWGVVLAAGLAQWLGDAGQVGPDNHARQRSMR